MVDFAGNRAGLAVRTLLVTISVATVLAIAACNKEQQQSAPAQAGPKKFA